MNDERSKSATYSTPLALSAILLLAAALRLWRIDALPPGFHFDESFEGLEAWRILTDPAYRPIFLTGNFGVPPLNAYLNAGMFWLFERFGGEAGPTAMRTTAAVMGVAGVALTYALATELRHLDRRLTWTFPLSAGAALAVMRWHIHFSRMGIEPIIVPVVWAGAMWLFLRGWRTGAAWSFAGSGVCLALGMYTYQAAWVIPFLMIPVVGHLFVARRARSDRSPSDMRRSQLFGVLITALTAALLFAPLAWFFANNIDLVFLRPAQLTVVGETASPADSSVMENIWATAKMFGPFGRPGDLDPRRNLPGAPALNLWLAIPFYAGLLLALWRVRNPAYSIPLIGLIGLLAPGVFSEYAPHFHRIVGAAAPTALLIGVGMNELWRWGAGQQKAGFLEKPGLWLATAAITGLLLLGGITSARNYFGRWAALPDLFYAFDVGIWQLGRTTADAAADGPIYITPRGDEHATLAFAWRELTGAQRPTSFDGRHIFPLTAAPNAQAEAYAVIEHEDFRTPLLLPDVLPSAAVTQELFDRGGQLYARMYTRPAGLIPARPPFEPATIDIAPGLRVIGYDAQPADLRAGEVLYVQLHWLVEAGPTEDWTVFIHLADPQSGAVVAGHDSRPGADSLPMPDWRPGWRVLDEYQIGLPGDLPAGEYVVQMGLYAPDGRRLPGDGPGFVLGRVSTNR